MGIAEKITGGRPSRFAVITGDAPHLSARRQAVEARCPTTGLIMLFTDVMSVGNLRNPDATFACIGCGETHRAAAGNCRICG
jgi:hypothetical protein